jgi:23S rRNA (guanosine2251-2'-O)-methyltransferase
VSDWIWGRHPVLEALRGGAVESVSLAAGRHPAPVLEAIRKAAESAGVPVREVASDELARLVPGENTQGVAARLSRIRTVPLEELLPQGGESAPLLLLLDQVQDPHNLGALLRSASAAGVTGVVVTGRHSAPLSGTVAKTSAGAVFQVRIAEVANLARAMDTLRAGNIWITGLDGASPGLLYDVDLTLPSALVVGGEGSGLRRLTRERCDFLARLPMLGPTESLNASVAGSIALYEAVRQRIAGGHPPPEVR